MIRRGKHLAAVATVGVLLLASCGSDEDNGASATTTGGAVTTPASAETTPATEAPATSTEVTESSAAETEAPAEAWTVSSDDCPDPDAATAPIEGELKLGSYQPLSGSPAAAAFSPVTDGLKLYVQYANDNNLLEGVTLSVDIRDDQYDPTQTPGVVDAMIDEGVHVITGGIGTPNGLAVRDTLNEECIPQLLNLSGDPSWGDIENYPWTTGALVPYDIEAKIYAKKIAELKPGATVGVFTVNSDFGKVMLDAFKEAAAENGLEIVDEQTIEPTETAPPTNQVGSIAGNKPDVVMAVPLGAQCPTFLKELANAKAANAGWEPLVFQTNTCSSRLLISALAAGAGDGVYTSGNGIDPSDPKNAGLEQLQPFVAAYTAAGLTGDLGTTAVGWSIGEDTVKILQKAQESGTLSRASIIEAARNLEFTPSLGRDKVVYKLNGAADPYTFQSLQVLQWNQTDGTYTEIGDTITDYES
jgi:branched-chain amino acid transport system substrate-binding protein